MIALHYFDAPVAVVVARRVSLALVDFSCSCSEVRCDDYKA
jgi:hypothetical protein